MNTVADQFAEIMAIAGVKRIYGIVGDSLNGLTEALVHSTDGRRDNPRPELAT